MSVALPALEWVIGSGYRSRSCSAFLRPCRVVRSPHTSARSPGVSVKRAAVAAPAKTCAAPPPAGTAAAAPPLLTPASPATPFVRVPRERNLVVARLEAVDARAPFRVELAGQDLP